MRSIILIKRHRNFISKRKHKADKMKTPNKIRTVNKFALTLRQTVLLSLAVVAVTGIASGQTTNYVPDGDFENASPANFWVEASCCGGLTFTYPTSGGNPGGYATMDNPGPANYYGLLIEGSAGSQVPLTLASLGLTAGNTYTFVVDMKFLTSHDASSTIGGLKIEWDNASGNSIGDTGDQFPPATLNGGEWATYHFTNTIPAGTVKIKIMPEWGHFAMVGYDNVGVIVPSVPLSVAITSPGNGATVGTNYSIAATASVSPGTVTNVIFYDGSTLLGNATSSPFTYSVTGASAGSHSLKAIANDSNGNSATSSVVSITVSAAVINPYESFNYSVGSLATGTASTATGFSGSWTVGNGTIVAGLSYPNLPATNNALSTTGSRDRVAFANPISGGIKYVSFLFNQLGNNGGNLNGLMLTGSGAKSVIAGITAPVSGTVGGFGLGLVDTASAGATGISTFSGQQVNTFSYNQSHLIVLKVDYGADTISLWLDPAAGNENPTGSADLTWSSVGMVTNVGNITGMGFNIQGGGNADVFDEFTVADTYGDAVGYTGAPPPPVAANVYVDSSKTWSGYMTVYHLSGGVESGYWFGSSWGTAALDAAFNAGIGTLTPNTSIYYNNGTNDTAWYDADGAPLANMHAAFYVEDNTLAGKSVTFSGYCWTNSLVAPYTSVAFIKELDPSQGYATVQMITTPMVSAPNSPFSISMTTTNGHIIQYGFETVGPNANLALTPLATLGKVLVASNVQPAGVTISGVSPSPAYVTVSSNISLTVTTIGTPTSYQWKKDGLNLSNGSGISGANAATLTLSNVSGSAEGNYTIVVGDALSQFATNASYVVVFTPGNLSLDPNAAWLGYANTFSASVTTYPPSNPDFGFPVSPTSLLRATMSNGVAYYSPCTYLYDNNPTDPAWRDADGLPNRSVQTSYYIENADLQGLTLTLNGFCPSNTVDPSYTTVAYIRDLDSGYQPYAQVYTNLQAGKSFSLTLATTAGGHHISYGLEMFGLDNSSTNPITSGVAVVTVQPPTISASRSASSTSLSFLTVGGHGYTAQYKNSLADGAWQNLSTVSGTGATVIVQDTTSVAQRFYRLIIQ